MKTELAIEYLNRALYFINSAMVQIASPDTRETLRRSYEVIECVRLSEEEALRESVKKDALAPSQKPL